MEIVGVSDESGMAIAMIHLVARNATLSVGVKIDGTVVPVRLSALVIEKLDGKVLVKKAEQEAVPTVQSRHTALFGLRRLAEKYGPDILVWVRLRGKMEFISLSELLRAGRLDAGLEDHELSFVRPGDPESQPAEAATSGVFVRGPTGVVRRAVG